MPELVLKNEVFGGFDTSYRAMRNESDFDAQNRPLSSPFRNFTFENYPNLHNLHKKLSNCGHDFVTLLNKTTSEVITIPLYCDNRVCLNPDCQKHRLYKFMKTHNPQIIALNRNMISPKGWVFTDSRQSYPIDRFYCQERLKELAYLLDKTKHSKFGSNSYYSIHMEIKLHSDSWYLHFHVVSGGITNLRMVRAIWGKQIKYEDAINPVDLGFYVSKYASKVPSFPNTRAYLEYNNATYKLQMHRFSMRAPALTRESEWIIIERSSPSKIMLFRELDMWLTDYLNSYGFGG